MKVQQTPNLQLNNLKRNNTAENNTEPHFKGAELGYIAQFINFLDTNQAVGATAVDLGCMVIPRTIIDFTRGPEAGLETMRREFSSAINYSLIGVYGLGAALMFSNMFNKEFGIKAHKIFVSDELLEILGQIRNNHGDIQESDAKLNSYLAEIFENARGFNPDVKGCNANGWVKIEKDVQKQVVAKLAEEIKSGSAKMSKENHGYVRSLITASTGAEKSFIIDKNGIKSVSSLDDLINNVYKVTKSFMNSKVAETFKGEFVKNKFIGSMKKINKHTAIIGLALAMAMELCFQPINMYLTKKITGKTGFVGGGEKNDSQKFKILKLALGLLAGYGTIRSFSRFRFHEIIDKVKFKGLIPTMDQFKLVYGATVASRILSARNDNELRETTVKDSLGFLNWLVLGSFVSKFAAMGFEKMAKFKNDKFIRYNEVENGKGFFNKLIQSSIVSRDEVLCSALKEKGISVLKEVNGKKVAMNYRELLKTAAEHAPQARMKVRYLGLIQFAGYLYSGLALGIGLPKFNIAMTNYFEKKHKAEEAKNKK